MQTIMLQKYMGKQEGGVTPAELTKYYNAQPAGEVSLADGAGGLQDILGTTYNPGQGPLGANAGISNSTLTSALQAVLGSRGGAGATIPNTLGGATAGAGSAMSNLGIDPSTGQSKQQQMDYIAMLLRNLFPAGFKR